MRLLPVVFLLTACFEATESAPEIPASAQPAAEAPAEAPPAEAPAEEPPSTAHTAGAGEPAKDPAASLPDVTQGLVKGQCANGPGAEGADSHFAGTLRLSGDSVSGEERWILFSNPKWEARGGKDCEIVWAVSGTKTPPPATCGSCSYGVRFKAEPDFSRSNCPEEMMHGHKAPTGETVGGEAVPFEQSYGVKVAGDRATVYFGQSGKQLGEGYANDSAVVWVSDHQCKWF